MDTLLWGGDAATPRDTGDVGDLMEEVSTGSGTRIDVGRVGKEGAGSSSSEASGVY